MESVDHDVLYNKTVLSYRSGLCNFDYIEQVIGFLRRNEYSISYDVAYRCHCGPS